MGGVEFDEIRKGALADLNEPEKSIKEVFRVNYPEIFERKFIFDRKARISNLIQECSLEKVVKFFEKYISGPTAATLELHYLS